MLMPGTLVRQLAAIGLGALCQYAGGGLAAAQQEPPPPYFAGSLQTARYALILVGPAVGANNLQRFRQWGLSLHAILVGEYGYSADRITLLYDRGGGGFPGAERVGGAADRAGIVRALTQWEEQVQPGDQLILYLIGHGSGAGSEAKFHLVGPDFTAAEFAGLLAPFSQQDLVIVNTSSASFGFSAALSGVRRIVISATRSPAERYDPVFSGYFIEALEQGNADRDKNSRVSVLEAFDYARAHVQQWYAEQGRLPTEHAGLDDNGDALFSLTPGVEQGDGLLAQLAYFDQPLDDRADLSPEALRLQVRMQELERSVLMLRGRKADYLAADYWQRMEQLLIELAETTGQFDGQSD